MFDIDPQIIKVGKIFFGMIMGMFAARIIMDMTHVSGLPNILCGSLVGIAAGGGIMIVNIFKNRDKDEEE